MNTYIVLYRPQNKLLAAVLMVEAYTLSGAALLAENEVGPEKVMQITAVS
jgi:hypothetical protein